MTAQDSQEPNENNVSEPESLDHPAKSGWYDDPEGSGGLRWYDAKANKWSESVSEAAHVNLEPEEHEDTALENDSADDAACGATGTKASCDSDQTVNESHQGSLLEEWENKPSEILDMPVLENWKPAPAFSVLGAVSNFIVGSIVGELFGIPFVAAACCLVMILYAVIVYPSFYTSKPLIKSSKTISFFNYFVGWIVFGWCWNRNLNKSHIARKPKKGSSYIVFIVIYATLLIFSVVGDVTSCELADYRNRTNQEQQSSSSTAAQSSQGAQQHEDDVFSITFPTKPEYESSEEGGILAEYYKAKTDGCYVFVEVNRVNLDLQGENPYDFAAELAYSFLTEQVNTSITEDDMEKGTFDGCPAGYVVLGSEESGSVILCSTMLGKGYVLNIIIKADTDEKVDSVLDSLSLK